MKKVLILGLFLTLSVQIASAEDVDGVKAWLYASPVGQDCDQGDISWVAEEPARKYEIVYNTPWSDEDETYTFYEVLCYGGAYNMTSLFIKADEYMPGGFSLLSFAEPDANYVMYYVEDEEFGTKPVLESWTLAGFYSTNYLVNANVNEENNTLGSYAKGRGIGDAFSSNLYTFKNGNWLLTKSIVDPTFDGEITPITIFEIAE